LAAWWSGDVADLLASEPEAIVQRLAVRLVETHHLNRDTQLHAWRRQIVLLRTALDGCPSTWRILFEYPLLRVGRRIDAVLLTGHVIVVLEFKVGATSISLLDRQQTEDYALDLFDFHAGSRGHPVVPILVATEAQVLPPEWPLLWHGVTPVFAASAATAGVTAAGHCRTHPCDGAGIRDACVGSGTISTGADDRGGGDHAVQPAWGRGNRRGACRCWQSWAHHRCDTPCC
jgi:hypothetical protein